MITFWVAYSGGRDSHVLLHTLAQLRDREADVSVKAIHINHRLHSLSDQWEHHCCAVAQSLDIPFEAHVLCLDLQPGDSVEAKAREARYAIFAQRLAPGDWLLTAHTQDDQAETFLLQALRGAGPKGLGGIAKVRALGQGLLVRPFLGLTRDEINAYADHFKLSYIDDPSNEETRFRRNYIRHEIMPLLKTAFPGALTCLSRSSELCGQDNQLLDDYLEVQYQDALNETALNQLSCRHFEGLSLQQQCHLLRGWFSKNAMKLPSVDQCHRILAEVLRAKPDAMPHLVLPEGSIKRFKGKLILLYDTAGAPKTGEEKIWDLDQPLKWAEKQYQAVKMKGKGIALQHLPSKSLMVRYRQGGERCRLPGRPNKSVKKILQEMQIPPWERDQIPIFYYEDRLVALGSIAIAQEFAVTDPEEMGWVVKSP